MIIIGLTGSIGMGKTAVTSQLRALGAKTYNADDAVHTLLGPGGAAVAAVEKAFPGTRSGERIDREKLGTMVFGNPERIKTLEAILHPLVRRCEERFVHRHRGLGARLLVLDIPLLLETNGEQRCDLVLVVTAPPFIQRQRVMMRPRMSEEKFSDIIRLQMPDGEKRRRADVVIYTGLGKAYSFRQLKLLLHRIGIQ